MMTTIPTDREQLAMSMNDRQTGAYIFETLARTIEELCDPNHDGDSSKLASNLTLDLDELLNRLNFDCVVFI